VTPRQRTEVQELDDSVELTQYGEMRTNRAKFNNQLRVEIGEVEMSLILGRQTSLAAALLVTKTHTPWALARYTTVGTLRSKNFVVRHSPTKGNPLHVSVMAPASGYGPLEWDEPMAKLFDSCFTGPQGGGNS
jgi:hypothetical protein